MATSKIYLKYLCTSPHCSKPSGRWTYSSTSRRSAPCVRCVFTCSIGNSRTSLPQCPDGLDSRAVDLVSDAWTVTRDTGGYILLSRNGCWHRCLRLHCNGDLTQKIEQIPDWMKHSMTPCLREVSWAKSPHPGGCQLTSRVWVCSPVSVCVCTGCVCVCVCVCHFVGAIKDGKVNYQRVRNVMIISMPVSDNN